MVSYISLVPYMNRPEAAAELLSCWNEGIEILMDGPNWRQPLDWDKEIQRFAEYSGKISIHAPIFELNLASPRYEVIRQHSFEVYKECLEWAARINAESIVIHPNLHTTPIFLRKEAQECVKDSLHKLGSIAKEYGVELAVENVGYGSSALFNQEEFIYLFGEIPNISALLDVGHAHINRWDIAKVIKGLDEHFTAVHLHDNWGLSDEHQPIGLGNINWQPIWDALNDLEHEYRAIIEYKEDTSLEILLEHAELVKSQLRGKTGNGKSLA